MRTAFPARPLAIHRTLDGAYLTAVANAPEVRPHLLLPEGELDLRGVVGDPRNYCFETESGGFLGLALGYGRYDVHSLFVPERAPKLTVTAMREASEYMFTRTDCVELVTKVPEGNRRAGQLAAVAHFDERFVAPVSPRHTIRARYCALGIDTWALHACGLHTIGAWFHDALAAAKQARGSALATHPDDAVHDQMAGATVVMVAHGQVEKGVGFYNRWARWVGYEPILLLSTAPPLLDIGDAVIAAYPTEMEVVLCR